MKSPGWLPRPGDLYDVDYYGVILVIGVREEGPDGFNRYWNKPYGRRWTLTYVGSNGQGTMELDSHAYLNMRYKGSAMT